MCIRPEGEAVSLKAIDRLNNYCSRADETANPTTSANVLTAYLTSACCVYLVRPYAISQIGELSTRNGQP